MNAAAEPLAKWRIAGGYGIHRRIEVLLRSRARARATDKSLSVLPERPGALTVVLDKSGPAQQYLAASLLEFVEPIK